MFRRKGLQDLIGLETKAEAAQDDRHACFPRTAHARLVLEYDRHFVVDAMPPNHHGRFVKSQ